MEYSKEDLGHLVHSRDLEGRIYKPFWSEGEGAVPFDEFKNLTVSNRFLLHLPEAVINRIDVPVDSINGAQDLSRKSDAVKTEILRVISFGRLMDDVKNFEEGKKIFDDLCAFDKFKGEFLSDSFFRSWIVSCQDPEDKLRVLYLVAGEEDVLLDVETIGIVLASFSGEKMEQVANEIFSSDTFRDRLLETDFVVKVLGFLEDYKDCVKFLQMCLERGLIFDIKFFAVICSRCKDINEICAFLEWVNGLTKSFNKKVPNEVFDVVLDFVKRNAEDLAKAVFFIESKCIDIPLDLINKLQIDPSVCLKAKDIIVGNVRFRDEGAAEDGKISFDDLYQEYRCTGKIMVPVLVKANGFENVVEKVNMTKNFGKPFLAFYAKIRSGALSSSGEKGLLDVEDPNDFVDIVNGMISRGEEPTCELISSLNVKALLREVFKERLVKIYSEAGVDLDEFCKLSMIGVEFEKGVGWIKFYEYLNAFSSSVDLVSDYSKRVELMLSEGIDPDDIFIYGISLSPNKWISLRNRVIPMVICRFPDVETRPFQWGKLIESFENSAARAKRKLAKK